ncbi:hypothetical protein [Bradyrhizobium macuxiense]|nr:hypothetical protein [Bradyrhizobium macuxiense]
MSSDAQSLSTSETLTIFQSAFQHAAKRRFRLVHFMSGGRHDETARLRWSRSKRNPDTGQQA